MSVMLGRSPIRQAVLQRLVEDPQVGVSARGLAKDLGVHHGWLSLQLKALEEEGVLRSKPGARQRIIYFLNEESDTGRAVSALVEASTGLEDRIRSALVGLAGAEEVVLLPDGGEGTDIEVMVRGEVGIEDLGRRLTQIRERVGRAVSPTVFIDEDLERKPSVRRMYAEGRVLWKRRRVVARPDDREVDELADRLAAEI
ncbi:MAG: hypothetical protein ACYDGR_06710 [Candidatus Dormibacteria bacterium]